ncbi:hypothetical protein ORI20_30625 [Mycobacterium sp. CVI_P3]|uniref:Secreted protein n=1 Tax=Mycobacterium pinniadriaticum TaxID=2994102 RepID=A0ABT3SQ87_9MYCO|nr:hypothetical protein [Mycobacterium pinniadriaticum]MCX2934627.1 hypothetical protein [Mycobacterium pinniadriaticum]MCX2941050.1 hypothetical protein [Mycobacterium pinniadriaticum]
MKRFHVLSVTVGAGALVSLGTFAAVTADSQTDSGTFVSSGMSTGVTVTQSADPTAADLPVAVPAIKGPAPLPTEEQGLPG